jgi:hypothetical protein
LYCTFGTRKLAGPPPEQCADHVLGGAVVREVDLDVAVVVRMKHHHAELDNLASSEKPIVGRGEDLAVGVRLEAGVLQVGVLDVCGEVEQTSSLPSVLRLDLPVRLPVVELKVAVLSEEERVHGPADPRVEVADAPLEAVRSEVAVVMEKLGELRPLKILLGGPLDVHGILSTQNRLEEFLDVRVHRLASTARLFGVRYPPVFEFLPTSVVCPPTMRRLPRASLRHLADRIVRVERFEQRLEETRHTDESLGGTVEKVGVLGLFFESHASVERVDVPRRISSLGGPLSLLHTTEKVAYAIVEFLHRVRLEEHSEKLACNLSEVFPKQPKNGCGARPRRFE